MIAKTRLTLMTITLLAMAGMVGDRAAGYAWFQLSGVDLIWSTHQSDRWLAPTPFPPGSEISDLVINAMGLWGIVPGADFSYAYGHLDQDYPIDHFDGFNDTIAVDAATLDPGVLAVTTMVHNTSTLAWFDMDLEFADFPAGVGWNFFPNPTCQEVTDTGTYGVNFLLVATHELGHCLGLGHDPIGDEPPGSPWFIATMNPAYPSGGPVGDQNIIELHTDDRNGLRFLYPGTGPALTDLAQPGYATSTVVGLAIPVSFSPTVAVPGDAPVAVSVIENFGNTDVIGVRQGFYLSQDAQVDTLDTLLGYLEWDLPTGAATEFSVALDVPDVPAGTYYVGSILDDTEQIAEQYEDNNAVTYCEPLTVGQQVPDFAALSQQIVTCDAPFIGPAPQLAYPVNVAPVTWTLDNPQSGMTIDAQTGVITWPQPVKSPFIYELDIRATNAAGTSVQTLSLGVLQALPQVEAIVEQLATCSLAYDGPLPMLTAPTCMNPITAWSLLAGPADMTIDPATGIVHWPAPVPDATPYTISLQAANAVGATTFNWDLRVMGNPDVNLDSAVDLADYAIVEGCLDGPLFGIATGCSCADMDVDNDIDLADFAAWANAMEDGAAQAGACCFADGTCLDLTAADCATLAGSLGGAGTTCAATTCTGACCFGGGCLDFVLDDCSVAAGTFQGMQTDCLDVVCPPTGQGACCLPDQSCTLMTEQDCLSNFGAFRGLGLSCEVVDCVLPFGACCQADGSCAETTEGSCLASAGAFLGDATSCSAQSCQGACCYSAGGCLDLVPADCAVSGGAFQGQQTDCASTTCPVEP